MSNKIALIISNEYYMRVTKKSFIILTLLTPILFVVVLVLPALIMNIGSDSSVKTIAVIDRSGLYREAFTDRDDCKFIFVDDDLQQARKQHSEVTGFLYITGDLTDSLQTACYYSDRQPNSELMLDLRKQLSKYINQKRIDSYGIPNLSEIIAESTQSVKITTIKWDKNGSEHLTSSSIAEMFGLLSALLIYMFIFAYGGMVMQGVVQEKSNRIMEVLISSVRPFELMMGKIIGIALVGLTQFAIWVLIGGITMAYILPAFMPETQMSSAEAVAQLSAMQQNNEFQEIVTTLMGINLMKIIVLFVLYFIGGYLLYASMFAAVGAAVDNQTDSQQFTIPITIPIILGIFVAIYATNNPDSSLAFWCSLIPFTSPIVMLVRLPFEVAWWEIVLSLIILYLSFVGTTWLSGKIYRTGILMYGKTPTWKEIWKWARYN